MDEHLIALVRRELGVEDVRVLDAAAAASVAAACPWVATAELPDGRSVAAVFVDPPSDLAALQRRLEMICASRDDRTTETGSGSVRPAPTRTLPDELAALSKRAGALAAFVMDAHSPILWGIGHADVGDGDVVDGVEIPTPELAHDVAGDLGGATSANDTDPGGEDLVARTIDAVRALPEIETLPRGGHISAVSSEPDFGWLARSFAGIYILVLVFDAPFDELVARRAVLHALPAIEHLVLSLPPVDPSGNIGGQMVVRRRARRR